MPTENPLRSVHEAAGARLGEYFETILPSSFTNARDEYRHARESVAVADKNYRAFFNFTGPDRARYLNAILTNNIKDLQPGQGVVSLLLNPQGHILAELDTYATLDRMLVATYAMIRERTAATLDKFIIMDDVTLEDITDQLGVVSIEGPKSPQLIAALHAPALDLLTELGHAETHVAGIPCRMVRRSPGGVPGAEFITSRDDLPRTWQALVDAARALGGGPIGYEALNSLRLEEGIPWFGYDFDDKVIPHEAGLEQSHINYSKGCYTGQEIVERVRSRGHVNRRRVGVAFSGQAIPEAHTPLLAGGAEVGAVTRAGFSYPLGRPIGMAYLRREHNSVGSRLTWSCGEAEVIDLPIRASASAK
ncbi:MAG TPA: glycine cleavage T C-terminal barrel domain-containing protein [Candidatus Acidoferrales bacterium]|nr:glycine cleavage T C-terminal barrel domain-containing protein [Candidatus Acidoferrales bacterium]